MSEVRELLRELPIPLAIIIAEEIRGAVEEIIGGVGRWATRSITLKDVTIERVTEVLSVEGRGKVREAVVVADSPDFAVYVETDGRVVLDFTFPNLQKLSEVMVNVDAIDRDGEYLLRLSDISFLSSCTLRLRPLGRVTLKHVLVIYDVAQ